MSTAESQTTPLTGLRKELVASHSELKLTLHEWGKCAGLLKGTPAFILGNGPGLTADLTPLDGFFTVGVNRIAIRYDPVVLQWWDASIAKEHLDEIEASKAIKITSRRLNLYGLWNGLDCVGDTGSVVMQNIGDPSKVPVTGVSGVTAALWAMSLGCKPIYLVGMSGKRSHKGTNFYGDNRHHASGTLARVRRYTTELLNVTWVHPIYTQKGLNAIADALEPIRRDKQWYFDRFASVRTG